MKRINYFLVLVAAIFITAGCDKKISYKKTKSGLLYKIISSNSKDSTVKEGEWLKLNFTQKLNDSVLQTSYGKMPIYTQVATNPANIYNPAELFNMLRKGDSVITVALTDSLLKKGLIQTLPPFMKKGDRITTSFRVIEIFKSDSSYQADAEIEAEKDRPRQTKEQAEQQAKQQKEMEEQQAKEMQELEKSGELAKQLKTMENYLAAKKVNAQKTGKGTYVYIQQQGTGPLAEIGKYVKVKYTGKIVTTDSTFESGVYPFQLGVDPVITGWVEGLQLFKQGGKGTIYIPGFLAYGANPRPGSPFGPYEALLFDVELLEVSNQPIAQQEQVPPSR